MSDLPPPDHPEPGAVVPPVQDSRAPGGRLVLTPALRVGQGAVSGKAETEIGGEDPEADALRTLVRAILEEELQGPFGERITRAVRKLVRAEVATLLALRHPD